jgi:hypothetical protein
VAGSLRVLLEEWRWGTGGHGRKDMHSVLIESAQAILRSKDPLGHLGQEAAGALENP